MVTFCGHLTPNYGASTYYVMLFLFPTPRSNGFSNKLFFLNKSMTLRPGVAPKRYLICENSLILITNFLATQFLSCFVWMSSSTEGRNSSWTLSTLISLQRVIWIPNVTRQKGRMLIEHCVDESSSSPNIFYWRKFSFHYILSRHLHKLITMKRDNWLIGLLTFWLPIFELLLPWH